MTTTAVGAIGSTRQVIVDEYGRIDPIDPSWSIDWWIGADDRWHVPADEPAVRQNLVDDVPVVRTAMRVPGGDAVQHVYAAGGADLIVLDVENQSPAPFVLALVVRRSEQLARDDTKLTINGDATLATARAPSRWAATVDGTTHQLVTSGGAHETPFTSAGDRGGHLDAAFLYPVAHRTALRFALRLHNVTPDAGRETRLPDPADAARGWAAHLDRGLHLEVDDRALRSSVRAALSATLLAGARRPVTGSTIAALEDWGFDTEAAAAWPALGWRERRAAARRPPEPPHWSEVSISRSDAEWLVRLRALLAHDGTDGTVTLLGDLPPAWRGRNIDVRDAPTRAGLVSYAVRWHGPRPALLWEAPPGVVLRAPGLDPRWSTRAPSGEALLSAQVA